MAKKTAKKASGSKAAASKAAPARTKAAGRAAAAWGIGVAALGGAAGAVYGLVLVDARAGELAASGSPEVRFEWPEVEGGGGTWMPASEQERLKRLASEAGTGGSGLEVAPLREIARALAETGWFEGAPRAERTGEGAVRVSGAWRIPAAVVRTGSSERLIAWDGVALPLSYPIGQSGVRYLINPRVSEPSAAGRAVEHVAWPGEDVAGGLALLDLLDEHEGVIAQVHGVDLSRGGALEIITDAGSRVVWGSAPGTFRPGEQTAAVKMDRLRLLLEKTGRIDSGSSRVEITGPHVLLQAPGP